MTECCFCGRTMAASRGQSVKGIERSFYPDYCRECGKAYTEQLGQGWQDMQWAQDIFKMHRRLLYCENVERSWVRVESIGGNILAEPITGQPGAGDDILDQIIVELKAQGLGGNRIYRELKGRGWDISQRTVYYRLAGLRTPKEQQCAIDETSPPAKQAA